MRARIRGAAIAAVTMGLVLGMLSSAHARARRLPPKAAKAVKKAFPNAKIVDTELENENGVKLYEVTVVDDDRRFEVTVSPQGTLVEIENDVPVKDLPGPVVKTVAKHAKGGRITEAEKVEARAVVKAGKLVKLDKPRTFYEIEVRKGGKELEINVLPDGTLLGRPRWDDDDDDDDDD